MDDSFFINNGPSKYDLQKALFDRKGNGGKPHQVEFTTDDGVTLVVIVSWVEAEDGSGDSWNIEARVVRQFSASMKSNISYTVRGWFNTARRHGRLVKGSVPLDRGRS